MKKAALYARVSTGLQEKEKTIESQIAELKRQISSHGNVLTKEYIDDGHSGAYMDRPGLEQLRKDLKTNLFDTIYFLVADRIARAVAYQNIIIGEILKNNKGLVINGKDYIHNPENEFTLTVLGAVSQLERAKIMERHSRGKMHKLRMGQSIGSGHTTYGYTYIPKDKIPGSFVINKEEAKGVKYIFKAYAIDKLSRSAIIRHLENHNIPTKHKTVWDNTKVKNVITNSSYIGIKYYNTRKIVRQPSNPLRKLKYGKEVFNDRSEWMPVKVPPIISKNLFEKAQQRLKENREKYKNPKETQLLSNLIKCGVCGWAYSGYKRLVKRYREKDGKYKWNEEIKPRVGYICTRNIHQKVHSKTINITRCNNPEIVTHKLDSCVWNILTETMADPLNLKQYLPGLKIKENKDKARTELRLQNLEYKINKLTSEKNNLLKSYIGGEISREAYAKKAVLSDQEIINARAERTELINKIPNLHQGETVETSIENYCKSIKNKLRKCNDFNSKRQLALEHIQKIVFTNGQVKVYGSIPIQLKAYEDPDQTSEARKIEFIIQKWVSDKYCK